MNNNTDNTSGWWLLNSNSDRHNLEQLESHIQSNHAQHAETERESTKDPQQIEDGESENEWREAVWDQKIEFKSPEWKEAY